MKPFAIAWFLLPMCAGQSLKLHVDNLVLPEGAEVRFSALDLDTERVTRPDVIGQSEHFRVYLGDRGSYFDSDSRLFKYELLFQRAGAHGEPAKFEVRAEPVGQFPDQFRDLRFRLTGRRVDEIGTVRLAVHSVAGADDLVWKPDRDLFEVQLGGDQRLPL